MCRLMGFCAPVFAELGHAPLLLALRHPGDVAASLAARDGLGAARARLLWLRHVLEAERGTRGPTRTIVHYEDLSAPPVGAMPRCGSRAISASPGRIAGASAEDAVDAFLSPELRHPRGRDARRAAVALPAGSRRFIRPLPLPARRSSRRLRCRRPRTRLRRPAVPAGHGQLPPRRHRRDQGPRRLPS